MIKKAGISIPVANEEKTIKTFLTDLLQETSPLKTNYSFSIYIIMDIFSKDKTFSIVKEMSEKDASLKPVFYEESTGVVSCYLKGFKSALEDGCDYIIEMDSGGSHPPSKIKDIVFTLNNENYDVVFMSRFAEGGDMKNLPFYRKFISKGGTLLANLWLGTDYSDATSGFQAFKAHVLKSFDLDNFISKGGIYQTEMKYYCSNFKVKEIPFVYVGSSTAFKFKWILTALKTLIKIKSNKKNIFKTY